MDNNSEVKSNNIIFECMVSLKNNKYDTLLSLTEQNLVLKKKKGLFHKTYKVINDILINNIKIVDDKVQINQNKNIVTIYTLNDEFNFTCENVADAKKLIEEINKLLGKDHSSKIIDKVVKLLDKFNDTVPVVVTTLGTFKVIYDHKDEIIDSIKTMTNFKRK